MDRRTVFFVSDGTGITAQMLGHSLMTQFEGVEFNQVTLPFVDSTEKAEECVARIGAKGSRGCQDAAEKQCARRSTVSPHPRHLQPLYLL